MRNKLFFTLSLVLALFVIGFFIFAKNSKNFDRAVSTYEAVKGSITDINQDEKTVTVMPDTGSDLKKFYISSSAKLYDSSGNISNLSYFQNGMDVEALVETKNNTASASIMKEAEQNVEIINYLKSGAVASPKYGGTLFASYFDLSDTPSSDGNYYIWAVVSEYVFKDGVIAKGIVWNSPLVLHTDSTSGQLKITANEIPAGGTQYEKDIVNLFPAYIRQNKMFTDSTYRADKIKKMENILSEESIKFFVVK